MTDHTLDYKAIQLSLFKHHVEVGKSFTRDVNGQLESITNGQLINATVNRIELDHILDLTEIQINATGYEHLTYGVHKQSEIICLPEKNVTEGFASRTEKHFKPPNSGHPGIMCIDSDGVTGSPREMLLDAVPQLRGVSCLETTSSSSNIYSAFGAELRGAKGYHTFYAVDDAKDIPRVLDVMHKRLIIAGYDMSKVSSVGGYLERSCVDKMLSNSSQPIYMKANLQEGHDLVQNKTINPIYDDISILVTSQIPNLSEEESVKYIEAVNQSKARLADEMKIKRAEWLLTQPSHVSGNLALEQQILDGDFIIDTFDGKIAVKDLTPNHHGMTCRDPFGDGRGSYTQAMIFNMQEIPMIISHAHGGMKYRIIDASKYGFGQSVTIAGDTGVVENLPPPAIEYVETESGKTEARLGLITPVFKDNFEVNLLNGNKKPKSHFLNFTTILSNYGVRLRLNEISNKIEYSGIDDISDNNNVNSTTIKDLCTLNDMNTGDVDNFIHKVADKNRFNPVKEMISRKPWDGVKGRARVLFDTLDVISDNPDIEFKLFHKWLVGTYRIGLKLTETMPFVLVLQSLKGGEGKTAWLERLVVDKELFVSTNFDVKNKDELIKSTNRWITELGELDSIFNKSDLKALMQHLTNAFDNIRLPYAREAVDKPRRTSYCGTVNTERFLRDDSGDRRFWGIRVGPNLDYEHDIDMQQVWAEIAETTPTNYRHWLNKEENNAVIERNESEFKVEDPIISYLEEYFTRPIINDNEVFYNSTQIIENTNHKGTINQTKQQIVNKWLIKHNYKAERRIINGHKRKGYTIPNFSVSAMS